VPQMTAYLYTPPTDDTPEIERTVEVEYDYTPPYRATWHEPGGGPDVTITRVTEDGREIEVTAAEREDLEQQAHEAEQDRGCRGAGARVLA